jgi:hypothetical protein
VQRRAIIGISLALAAIRLGHVRDSTSLIVGVSRYGGTIADRAQGTGGHRAQGTWHRAQA